MVWVKRLCRWMETRRGKAISTAWVSFHATFIVMWLSSDVGRQYGVFPLVVSSVTLLFAGHFIIDNLLEMIRWYYKKEETDAELYEDKDGNYVVHLKGQRNIMVGAVHVPDEWGHGAGYTLVYIHDAQTKDWGGGGRRREEYPATEKYPGLTFKPVTEGGSG